MGRRNEGVDGQVDTRVSGRQVTRTRWKVEVTILRKFN